METQGLPSQHSSSPFIWFYLRPRVLTLMIGVHNPLLFLQLQPQLRRRRLFSRWFIFQGKPFLSLTLMSCPQLPLAQISVTAAAPLCFLCAASPQSGCMCPLFLSWTVWDEASAVSQNGFSIVDCLVVLTLEGDSTFSPSSLAWMLGWRGLQLYG